MKKALLLILSLALILALAVGCAPAATTTTPTTSGTTKPETTATTTLGEPTEIQFFIYDLRGVGEKAQPIVDLLNEITLSKLNVTAKFTWIGAADYVTQLNLAIAGNEAYDLCTIMPREGANFNSLTTNGQLMDITELANEYGSEMLDTVGVYVDAFSIGGKIYGIPSYRDFASFVTPLMRKDLVEKVGMLDKAMNLKSFAELEEIYAAVLADSGVAPVGGTKNASVNVGMILGDGNFSDIELYDSLGDGQYVVYTDLETGKVSLIHDHPKFKAQMEMMRKWNQNNWIYKDSMVTDDHPDTLTKAGVIFSAITNAELGVESTKSSAIGYEMIAPRIGKFALASYNVNKFGTGVPVSADEPEAAVMWLNELMRSPEMMNLIDWGEEGVDYVVKDGEGVFPDGVDAKNVRYHTVDFLVGNAFLALPWQGQGKDFRTKAAESLASAPVSPFLGFVPNLTSLANELAAMQAANDQYRAQIFCGAYTDADYAAYVAALKTAGVDKYLAELQKQLDAWVANK